MGKHVKQAEWEREDLYNRDRMGKGGCVQQAEWGREDRG